MSSLSRLTDIMARLRDPEHGCPWDRAQRWETIVPHTLEEAYEVADVIERDDLDALPDELGDLLFQVVFYCQLGREQGRFDIDDVIASIADKLERRHPHVFGDTTASGTQEVSTNWERIKAEERRERAANSEMDDVPRVLPALTRARKIQRRAARLGFDWPALTGVWDKLDEEIGELKAAVAAADPAAIDDELGDLLFQVVNLARHLEVEPEGALRAATAKFERRFRAMEAACAASGTALAELSLDALNALWDRAKQHAD